MIRRPGDRPRASLRTSLRAPEDAGKGYLLDAHVLLWWLAGSNRLGIAGALIADRSNRIFVSAAALWELAIKRALGRLDMPDNLLEVLAEEQIEVLAVDGKHALSVASLPLHHGDPFDRMQVAQARLESLTMVTHDERIALYDVAVTRV